MTLVSISFSTASVTAEARTGTYEGMKTFCSMAPMPRIEPIPPIVTWEKVFQTTRPTKNHAAKTPSSPFPIGGAWARKMTEKTVL